MAGIEESQHPKHNISNIKIFIGSIIMCILLLSSDDKAELMGRQR